jgi:hypothetical protein
MRKQDEEERRLAQINIEHFKSFIARRRWKVCVASESRLTRTVVTNYRDSDGVVRTKKMGFRQSKSAQYEGEYSETESEASDTEESANDRQWRATRQKLVTPANIPLKPVKMVEYNETFDDDDDDDDRGKRKMNTLGAAFESKITLAQAVDPNLVSHESKQFETSDVKTIEHVDEATGASVRTSITQNVNTNEDIKVCKVGQQEQVEQQDDGSIVKRITTKTRTMKTVKKTTTTTTSKKGICLGVRVCVSRLFLLHVLVLGFFCVFGSCSLGPANSLNCLFVLQQSVKAVSLCNKIIRKSQMRLSTISLENINCISIGRGLLEVSSHLEDWLNVLPASTLRFGFEEWR